MSLTKLDYAVRPAPAALFPVAAAHAFDWWRGLAGALLWMVAAELSRAYSFSGSEMSLVWPPDGIALGLVLAYGRGMVPAIGLGVMAWHLRRGIALDESLIGAFSLMLALYVVWRLVRRDRRNRREGNPLAGTLRYHLLTVLPGAAILTALGSWQFLLNDALSGSGALRIVLVMGISEVFGILLFTRLTELLARAFDRPGGFARIVARPWHAWWFAALAAIALLAHLAAASELGGAASSVRYMVFVLLVWAAWHGQPLFVHITTALSALTLLALTPTGVPDSGRAFLVLDQALLMVCLAALGLFASAAIEHRRAMERSLRAAAHQDALTGLLNERGLAVALEGATPVRVLVGVHVSNFEQIEGLVGMTQAREIERDIAARLRELAPLATALARPRDGFFAAVLPARQDVDEVTGALQQVLAGRRYVLGERGVRIRIALGALALEQDTLQPDEVLPALLLACQVAGDTGDAPVLVNTRPAELVHTRREQMTRVEALREALRDDAAAADGAGLWLACQPIEEARPGAGSLGIEILLRWNAAPGVPLPPSEFLPLAERHGMMPLVDRWVMRQTARALRKAHRSADALGKVSINLSGASMSDATLRAYLADAIASSGLPAERFCFEVTETASIAQRSRAIALLEGLRALGARTALDDFGTGLATFDYLKSLPLDYVKIDGSFVRGILTSRVDQRIVAATCEVAQALGLKTVAEFVETPQQRALLATYGVDYVQGYGIAKPLPLGAYLSGPAAAPVTG